jgi:hypothetical protein
MFRFWLGDPFGSSAMPKLKTNQVPSYRLHKQSRQAIVTLSGKDQDAQRDSRMEGDGKPTYWARWAGFDGTVGPWSLPLRLSSARKAPAKAAKPEQDAGDADQSLRLAA